MDQVYTLRVWRTLSYAAQAAAQEAWNLETNEGHSLANEVADCFATEFAGVVDVRPIVAWDRYMIQFYTPLIFNRSALPVMHNTPTYLGFVLRPMVARDALPPALRLAGPQNFHSEWQRFIEANYDEIRQTLGLPQCGVSELSKVVFGHGFWT